MIGGRKVRSNKGVKRGPYGPRSGVTRSGRKFRGTVKKVSKKNKSNVRPRKTRKVRSNKGKKERPLRKKNWQN